MSHHSSHSRNFSSNTNSKRSFKSFSSNNNVKISSKKIKNSNQKPGNPRCFVGRSLNFC